MTYMTWVFNMIGLGISGRNVENKVMSDDGLTFFPQSTICGPIWPLRWDDAHTNQHTLFQIDHIQISEKSAKWQRK